MSATRATTKLIFAVEDVDRQLAEAKDRGYLSHVLVEVDGARLYPVFFYAVDCLKYELEASAKHGQPFIAETGMIVLPNITLVAMQDAAQRLCEEGYFKHLIPLTRERLANANPLHWPP